jgi:hypothetical protein
MYIYIYIHIYIWIWNTLRVRRQSLNSEFAWEVKLRICHGDVCWIIPLYFCAVWSVSGSIQNGIDLSAIACEACPFKIPKFNLILLKNSTEEWQEIAGVGGNVLPLSQWPSPICGSWFYLHEVTFTCLRIGIWYCNVQSSQQDRLGQVFSVDLTSSSW